MFGLVLVLLSGFAAFSSQIGPLDIKSEAMGGVVVPGGENDLAWAANPAGIVFRRRPVLFSAAFGWSDTIDGAAFAEGRPNPFLQDPLTRVNIRFSGGKAALSLDLANFLVLNSYGPDRSWGDYNACNLASVQLAVAEGKGGFGLGFSVRGGKRTQRTHIRIDNGSAAVDYVMQTMLERYKPSVGSEFFSASLGVMGKLGRFYLGLAFDELSRLDEKNNIAVSPTAMLQTLRLGVHFRGERYDFRTTGLLFVVPSAGVEIHDAFYDLFEQMGEGVVLSAGEGGGRRSGLRAGLELMFQLSSTFSISFLNGLESGPLGKGFVEEASHSLGVSLSKGRIQFDMAFVLPFALYQGRSRRARLSLGGSIAF